MKLVDFERATLFAPTVEVIRLYILNVVLLFTIPSYNVHLLSTHVVFRTSLCHQHGSDCRLHEHFQRLLYLDHSKIKKYEARARQETQNEDILYIIRKELIIITKN